MENETYLQECKEQLSRSIAHLKICVEGLNKRIAKETAELARLGQIETVAENALEKFKRDFPNGWTPTTEKPKKPPFRKPTP